MLIVARISIINEDNQCIENIKMNIASVKTFKFQKLTIIRNILSTIIVLEKVKSRVAISSN